MKFLRTLAAAAALAASCLPFAACNSPTPPAPRTNSYTVTVECEDTLILSLLEARLTAPDGTVAAHGKLNSEYRVRFDLEGSAYTASLISASTGYDPLSEYNYTPLSLTAEAPSGTITLTEKSEDEENGEYSVTVVTPDGLPFAGAVVVQLCGGSGICVPLAANSGVAVFHIARGVYEVHIDPPEGYTFDDTRYKIGPEDGAIEVTLERAN